MPLVGGQFVKNADPALIEELKRRGVLWKAGTIDALVSALLALRHAAAVLRAHVVVRAHDVVQGRDAGAQRARRLASARGRRGAVRRVAGEQHRLGDLARPLLGHAAAGVGVRRATPTHRRRASAATPSWPSARARRSATDFDPHKPHIDAYTWPCREAGCGGTMRRTPEVIDTWFDSGSMPFAQWHYPFENATRSRRSYPGGLHRRGRGPDARLVLLAARDRDGAGRRAAEQRAMRQRRAPYRVGGRERPRARRRRARRCRRAAATSSIRGR